MIVRSRPRVWELFTFWRLSILPQVAWQVASVAVSASRLIWRRNGDRTCFRNLGRAPCKLLDLAFPILLAFSNGACYERGWEARRQLGAMVGEMRSLARVTLETKGRDRRKRERLVRGLIVYTYSLMAHLREEHMPAEVALYCGGVPAGQNTPDALLRMAGTKIGAMPAESEFGETVYVRLDERLTALTGHQVACERRQSMPGPFIQTLLLHRTAYAFLLPASVRIGRYYWMGNADPRCSHAVHVLRSGCT